MLVTSHDTPQLAVALTIYANVPTPWPRARSSIRNYLTRLCYATM